MSQSSSTLIRSFQWIAISEGISFLLILFVTMPLKYLAGMPTPNYVVGMAHGVLFMAYLAGTLAVAPKLHWKKRELLFAIIASFLPFATFWVERKLVKAKMGE